MDQGRRTSVIKGWMLAPLVGCAPGVPPTAAPDAPPAVEQPRTRGSSAESTRAQALLKAVSACPDATDSCGSALCDTPFGPGSATIVAVPLPDTSSGSTGAGLVPMGPVFEAAVDATGALRHFGIAPDLVVCPHDDLSLLSGYWQTGGRHPQALARELAPVLALWLRPDGTYVKGIPDWEVELGVWQPSDDGVLLRPVHHILGSGGSDSFVSGDYEFHGSMRQCTAETLYRSTLSPFELTGCDTTEDLPCRMHGEHTLRRVAHGIPLDEAFLVEGCR